MIWSSYWGCRKLLGVERRKVVRVSMDVCRGWEDVCVCGDVLVGWGNVMEWKRSSKSVEDWRRFENRYWREVLRWVDGKEFVRKYEGCVLVCWEKDVRVCHRGVLGRWVSWCGGVYGGEIG